jgi:Cys-tRNA(Pro)/Cys-tRNA(Cys) deacylase
MRNQITRILDKQKINYLTHELPAEKLSAEEVARYLDVELSTVFKTLVTIDRKTNKVVLALIPAQRSVDLKSLARHLRLKKVQMASQREAEQITGLQTGGISPLALLHKNFRVVIDQSALDHAQIYVSGGQRGLDIQLAPLDLIKLTNALCLPISARIASESSG